MTAIRVFDPAMCCSTGVCGPSVDPALVRFAADLDWLKARGVSVERFNLARQPAAFVADASVKAALDARGEASLPLVKVNDEIKSTGVFPSRDQLAAWAGLAADAAGPDASTGCCGGAAPARAGEPAGGCCGDARDDGARELEAGCCAGGAEPADRGACCAP